jgi:hypothetical protein
VGVVRGLVGMGWVWGWMGVGVGSRMKDWMRVVSYSAVRLFFAKIMRGIRKQPPSKMLANPRPLYGGQPP